MTTQPTPNPARLQIQDSAEWEALVARAFDALDKDHSGRIGLLELEELLCGQEGCEVRGTLNFISF